MKTPYSDDDLVNAVRWRLGIPVDGNEAFHRKVWDSLMANVSSVPAVKLQVDRIGRFLTDLVEQTVRQQLGLSRSPGGDEPASLDHLWKLFKEWLSADVLKRSPRVSGLIKEAVTGRKAPEPVASPAPSAPRSLSPGGRPPAAPSPSARPVSPTPPPQSPPLSANSALRVEDLPLESISSSSGEDRAASSGLETEALPSAPLSDVPSLPLLSAPVTPIPAALPTARPVAPRSVAGSQWVYRAVPADEPDPHPEDGAEAFTTPDGDVLLAARVRGKKHKHEGTHGDDWFRVAPGRLLDGHRRRRRGRLAPDSPASVPVFPAKRRSLC